MFLDSCRAVSTAQLKTGLKDRFKTSFDSICTSAKSELAVTAEAAATPLLRIFFFFFPPLHQLST
jgi:hypothetical protein